jgi:oxazoline/thiazoline synthase
VTGARPELAWINLGAEPVGLRERLSRVFRLSNSAAALLVTADDYLHPELPALARSRGGRWMLARQMANEIWLGPCFTPGQSPCWFCLAHWIKTNRPRESAASGDRDYPYLPAGDSGMESSCLDVLVAAASRLASAERVPALESAVLIWHDPSLPPKRAAVHRKPGCNCPVTEAGTVDLLSWVNPFTGIIPGIEVGERPIAGWYQARCQYMRPLPVNGARPWLLPGDAWGSGRTPEEAVDSCAREALERYCSVWTGNEPEFYARFRDLHHAIDPRSILNFSNAQYLARLDIPPDGFHWVPRRFSNDEPCAWTTVTNILTGECRAIAAAIGYLWRSCDSASLAIGDSNGCAAGASIEDAQYRALLELIERDAVAIWWYNRLVRPCIRWEGFGDTLLNEAIGELNKAGIYPTLLDLTTDCGVPVLAAVAYGGDEARPFFGAAADPDLRSAARRALAEMIQFRAWSEPDPAPAHPPPAYLAWEGESNPPPATSSIHGIVDLAGVLAKCGLDSYWLDLTRPEIGLPVARVIVPGLRHAWRRLGPGRLYDVPVALGWLSRPRAEGEMNPISCPL